MEKNYDELIRRMKMRANPDGINETVLFDANFKDELQKAYGSKVAEYVKRAMRGVDPLYTKRTYEAGNKVKGHLRKGREHLDFEYQGSVPTNTHIKGNSDIDLVQITNAFYWHDGKSKFEEAYNSTYNTGTRTRLANVINGSRYQYSELETLKIVRLDAEKILLNVYKNVNVLKGKSIEVEPTDPKRLVDVVTAAWHKSVNSVVNNKKEEQGIKIYNKNTAQVLPVDYPFLKIRLVNEKDSSVNGRLKRMIRFLKVLKVDADTDLNLSSFDISSICYDIETWKYSSKSYIELVKVLYDKLYTLNYNETERNNLMSIDNTEPIFRGKDEKVESLKTLLQEVNNVIIELGKNVVNTIYG